MEHRPLFEAGQELSLERGSSTAKTILRGWKSGQYLMVDMPSAHWSAADKTPIIGRLFIEDTYYGFTTQYLGVLRELKLLILRYPEDKVDTSYRKSSRIGGALPVTIMYESAAGKEEDKGVITNISEEGCQIVCSRSFQVNDKLLLSVDFPTGSRIENIACILRYVASINNKFSYGAEFDVIDDDELNPVKEFLERLSAFLLQEDRS